MLQYKKPHMVVKFPPKENILKCLRTTLASGLLNLQQTYVERSKSLLIYKIETYVVTVNRTTRRLTMLILVMN